MTIPKDRTITITADDLKLLAGMSFDWDGSIECGGIATDFKRPFGSSGDISIDVQRLLGRPPYDPETGESAMTYDEVRQHMYRLCAVVEALRRSAVQDVIGGKSSLIGQEVIVPWRAARLMEDT